MVVLTSAGYKRYAKRLDKRLGSLQRDNARLLTQIHNARGGIKETYNRYSKYRTEYDKLSDEQKLSRVGKRLEKKGKQWLTKSIEAAAISTIAKDKLERGIKETNRLLDKIQNDPNLLTYWQRSSTYGYSTKDERKAAVQTLNSAGLKTKKARQSYGNDWASGMKYDRTRVRYATPKERKKNLKRRTERQGNELFREYYYYY